MAGFGDRIAYTQHHVLGVQRVEVAARIPTGARRSAPRWRTATSNAMSLLPRGFPLPDPGVLRQAGEPVDMRQRPQPPAGPRQRQRHGQRHDRGQAPSPTSRHRPPPQVHDRINSSACAPEIVRVGVRGGVEPGVAQRRDQRRGRSEHHRQRSRRRAGTARVPRSPGAGNCARCGSSGRRPAHRTVRRAGGARVMRADAAGEPPAEQPAVHVADHRDPPQPGARAESPRKQLRTRRSRRPAGQRPATATTTSRAADRRHNAAGHPARANTSAIADQAGRGSRRCRRWWRTGWRGRSGTPRVAAGALLGAAVGLDQARTQRGLRWARTARWRRRSRRRRR